MTRWIDVNQRCIALTGGEDGGRSGDTAPMHGLTPFAIRAARCVNFCILTPDPCLHIRETAILALLALLFSSGCISEPYPAIIVRPVSRQNPPKIVAHALPDEQIIAISEKWFRGTLRGYRVDVLRAEEKVAVFVDLQGHVLPVLNSGK